MKKRNRTVSLAPIPKQGDHGPRTQAQMGNAELVPIGGDNPNNIYVKRIKNVLKELHMQRKLTMRQYQAGSEIQDAYACCEMLSSGSPLKEQVDSTPRPDRFVASQVDAQSRLEHAMRAVTNEARAVVEVVCWHNQSISVIANGRRRADQREILCKSLDMVADVMKY